MKRSSILIATASLACAAWVAARRRQRFPSLYGKIVLITGSSRGLGLALAEEFGSNGARLAVVARDPEELVRAQKQLLARGVEEGDIFLVPCDLTDAGQTREMVRQVEEHFGRIDVLVNNAGVIQVGPVEDQPLSAFKEAMESNYYTALHTTMAALPEMLERRDGHIVNIASIGGKVAVPHLLPYSASKFALVGFSRGLNSELRSKGIRVTTVCPGLMRTGSHVQAEFTGDRQREYRWFSLGASLPGISTSAKSAARQIVRATVEKKSELTITPQAVSAALLAQLAPETTAALLGWVNSALLPSPVPEEEPASIRGAQVRQKEIAPLTIAGRNAERRFNQS